MGPDPSLGLQPSGNFTIVYVAQTCVGVKGQTSSLKHRKLPKGFSGGSDSPTPGTGGPFLGDRT